MTRTPKYELIEDRLGSPLADRLRYWQTAGVSATAIARLLTMETRVKLSGEAVRNWLRALKTPGDENGEAA